MTQTKQIQKYFETNTQTYNTLLELVADEVVDVKVVDDIQQMLEPVLVQMFCADVGRVLVRRDVMYRDPSF